LNPSTGSALASRGLREKAEEMAMEMAAQCCSRLAVHDVHGWVVAMSSGRHHDRSLLGSHGASLHSHGPVGALAALRSIQCLRPWPC
jgi:hypothetical protein